MPKNLSDLPSMSWTTSAATPTAWRCPMIGFSQPIAEKSPLVTGTEKITNRKKTMTLDAHEFIRRFLLHVIPKGFVRVRHFGFLANRSKSLLAKCRQLLDLNPAVPKLPAKISSRADAPTHRHRYHSMPSMPKGNSGLPCQPARPCTMGFFVMIDQRTKNRVFAPLCARAQRIGSPCFITSRLVGRLSIAFRYPVATNRCVKDCPVFSRPPCCYVCFGRCPPLQSP